MLDQHWFTAGVGTDGFDGREVGFDTEKFKNNVKDAEDIINLPTVKDMSPRHMAMLSKVILAHAHHQEKNLNHG